MSSASGYKCKCVATYYQPAVRCDCDCDCFETGTPLEKAQCWSLHESLLSVYKFAQGFCSMGRTSYTKQCFPKGVSVRRRSYARDWVT